MKKYLKTTLGTILAMGAAIGLARFGSNVYGSLNPMLALIFFAGQKQGKLAGGIIGVVATLVSSIYCGFGPWVIMQLPLWTVAGVIGGCVKSKATSMQFICAYGFMFGVIMDVFSFYTNIIPMYPNVIIQVLGGIPFDMRYCFVSVAGLSVCYGLDYAYKVSKNFVVSKLQPVLSR